MACERQMPNKVPVQRWRFLTLVVMGLTALTCDGAEPPPQPLLVHGLTSAQVSSSGAFAGAIQHLQRTLKLGALPVPLTADSLKSVRMVWLVSPMSAPPGDGAIPDPATIASTLLRYVEDGGSLWMMIQGEAGTPGSEWAQAILSRLGVVPGNRRTGAKRLRLPERPPWMGGLTWTTGGITPLDIEESPILGKAVLVPNDLAQKPFQEKAPDYAGLAIILGELGKGRVVILGDAEWLKRPAWDAPASDNRLVLEGLLDWTMSRSQERP